MIFLGEIGSTCTRAFLAASLRAPRPGHLSAGDLAGLECALDKSFEFRIVEWPQEVSLLSNRS
jgi:hypothetical protein